MIQRLGSSLVKFKSKIAGAIWRNLDDKLTEVVSLKDFGAKGDGKTNDQDAVNAAMTSGKRIDGAGATYKVSSLPDMERFYNTRFVWERLAGQPLYYVSKGFINGELYKITDNPYYNAWPQDKAFVYENVIYAPYMGSDRHGVSRLHVSWVKSGDDGQTWSTPEWLTDLHPDYPTVNYHCMSMGVCRNRLFAMIETRTLAENALTNCALWDRPMSRSLHLTGGITKAANQQYATIHVPDHGLFVGDFVNFSNSAVTGVSGDMTVATVIDKDNFTVLTPNQQTSDLNNAGKSWHMGTSFHKSPWRKTDLGLIPSVTEVHSFATIDNNGFVMGYHQGDVAPREVGLFYFPDAFNSPSNYVRRQIPSEYEPDASEPCIKYYDGVLYLITRGTRGDKPGSSLHRSRNIGRTWESLRFPHNVHHTTLPFAKVGDDLIMFGSERAENEWEAGAPDDRYKASYPRTFYARLNVNKWNADDIEWVNITDQIYQGDIVNSSVGVGSVVVKDSYIYYIFGGENHFNPMTYGDNKNKDPFKGHGHPTDIYCYKMQIANDNRVSRKFTYGATPGQAIPTFMGTDGIRNIPAPLYFSDNIVTEDTKVGHLTLKASTSSNIRSEVQMEGEYGFIGKSVPKDNPTGQRLIICGGEKTSSSSGAQITLHGSNSSKAKRITYHGNEHLFQGAPIMPAVDNLFAAGGPSNRFTTIYLGSDPVTTSDADHKYSISSINIKVLKAWSRVGFKQYGLNSEAERDLDSIHFGVLAQDIVAAFEAEGLDAIKYGIVSFEEGRYGVRYSEVLILEAAYTRYRLDKLEEMYTTNKIS